MKTLTALFASTKYWTEEEERNKALSAAASGFQDDTVVFIVDGNLSQAKEFLEYDTLIVVPLSGSVQPEIVELCGYFDKIIFFAGYVPGNFDLQLTDKMLCKNAGPTIMDTYGTVKRCTGKIVTLKKSFPELLRFRESG